MEQVTNLIIYCATIAKDTKVKIRKNQYVSTAGNLILLSLNLSCLNVSTECSQTFLGKRNTKTHKHKCTHTHLLCFSQPR